MQSSENSLAELLRFIENLLAAPMAYAPDPRYAEGCLRTALHTVSMIRENCLYGEAMNLVNREYYILLGIAEHSSTLGGRSPVEFFPKSLEEFQSRGCELALRVCGDAFDMEAFPHHRDMKVPLGKSGR